MDNKNIWGEGIPKYKDSDLMTKEEIFDFGLEVIYGFLIKEKYRIIDINKDINKHPNFICEKHDTLYFVEVDSDIAPKQPEINLNIARLILTQAKKFNAICLYASCSFGSTDSKRFEQSLALKDDGYYCNFTGFKTITDSDEFFVFKDSKLKK